MAEPTNQPAAAAPKATKAAGSDTAAVAPTVLVSGEQHARQQLAEEMRELAKAPLDRAPAAGGVFLRADGKTYQNAHGVEVTAAGKPKHADAA